MLFYYVRHGDPVYQPDSLTPLGLRQAEAVGRRLAHVKFDKVFVSSSERAKLTAKPLLEMRKMQAEPELDWANEIHAWRTLTTMREDGKPAWMFTEPRTRKLFAEKEMYDLGFRWYDHPYFAGHDYESAFARIRDNTRALFASLGYDFDEEAGVYRCTSPADERVALFAHEGFGLAFLSVVLNVPYPQFCLHFDMSHTGVTVVRFRDEGGYAIPCAQTLADDGHLYAERLATRYQNGEPV